MVLGIALPVIDVDLRKTRDEEFEFLFVENSDQVCWNDFMEAWLRQLFICLAIPHVQLHVPLRKFSI